MFRVTLDSVLVWFFKKQTISRIRSFASRFHLAFHTQKAHPCESSRGFLSQETMSLDSPPCKFNIRSYLVDNKTDQAVSQVVHEDR